MTSFDPFWFVILCVVLTAFIVFVYITKPDITLRQCLLLEEPNCDEKRPLFEA